MTPEKASNAYLKKNGDIQVFFRRYLIHIWGNNQNFSNIFQLTVQGKPVMEKDLLERTVNVGAKEQQTPRKNQS